MSEIIDRITSEFKPKNPRSKIYRELYNRRSKIARSEIQNTRVNRDLLRFYFDGKISSDVLKIMIDANFATRTQLISAINDGMSGMNVRTVRQYMQIREAGLFLERTLNVEEP